jgi:hypothetical protein
VKTVRIICPKVYTSWEDQSLDCHRRSSYPPSLVVFISNMASSVDPSRKLTRTPIPEYCISYHDIEQSSKSLKLQYHRYQTDVRLCSFHCCSRLARVHHESHERHGEFSEKPRRCHVSTSYYYVVNSIYESAGRETSPARSYFSPLSHSQKLDYLRVVTIQISLGLKTCHAVVRFRKCRRG